MNHKCTQAFTIIKHKVSFSGNVFWNVIEFCLSPDEIRAVKISGKFLSSRVEDSNHRRTKNTIREPCSMHFAECICNSIEYFESLCADSQNIFTWRGWIDNFFKAFPAIWEDSIDKHNKSGFFFIIFFVFVVFFIEIDFGRLFLWSHQLGVS